MADQKTTHSTASLALERALQRVATDRAYDEWDRYHGFGLYHTGPAVIAAEIASARKTVDKWYGLLEEAIRADERAKIAAES